MKQIKRLINTIKIYYSANGIETFNNNKVLTMIVSQYSKKSDKDKK